MTLNDRERFILHMMSITVTNVLMKKLKNKEFSIDDIEPMSMETMDKMFENIRKNRCRKLSTYDVDMLCGEINEEMMLGGIIHRENV
tara:strand:+ start:182 stop:442 length:261 start_codon:yes stop_codon:yes gene_type:complete